MSQKDTYDKAVARLRDAARHFAAIELERDELSFWETSGAHIKLEQAAVEFAAAKVLSEQEKRA